MKKTPQPAAAARSEALSMAKPVVVTTGTSRRMLGVIVLERQAILGEVGASEELERAALIASASGNSIDDALRDRIRELRAQREQIVAAQREQSAARLDAMHRAAPAMGAAIRELERLGGAIKSLRSSIEGFDSARDKFKTHLLGAGLSLEEIEAIEIRPTLGDLSRWRTELADAVSSEADLDAKLRRGADAFLPVEGV